MGSNSSRPPSIGSMVINRGKQLHQLVGVESNKKRSTVFREHPKRKSSRNSFGQLDSNFLFEERGGDTLDPSQPRSSADLRMGRDEQCLSSPSIRERKKQCSSRFTKQAKSSDFDRVDVAPTGGRRSLSPVTLQHRPLRHSPQLQISDFFQPVSRSSSTGNRRLSPVLGSSGCIRLSSLSIDSSGTQQGHSIQRIETDFDNTILASEGVVPRSSQPSHRPSESVACKSRSTQTASLSSIPPKHPRATSDRLETSRKWARFRGYAKKAAERGSLARRSSSLAGYQSRWKVFRDWCKLENHSSSSPTIPVIADFLIWL